MSNNWFSARFQKRVYLTRHAETRMQQRLISEEVVTDLIETGMLKYKDDQHFWIYKEYVARNDNLLCAAIVAADTVIIKTIMSHWQEDV